MDVHHVHERGGEARGGAKLLESGDEGVGRTRSQEQPVGRLGLGLRPKGLPVVPGAEASRLDHGARRPAPTQLCLEGVGVEALSQGGTAGAERHQHLWGLPTHVPEALGGVVLARLFLRIDQDFEGLQEA